MFEDTLRFVQEAALPDWTRLPSIASGPAHPPRACPASQSQFAGNALPLCAKPVP